MKVLCDVCGAEVPQLHPQGTRRVCWPRPNLTRESHCWYARRARHARERKARAKAQQTSTR